MVLRLSVPGEHRHHLHPYQIESRTEKVDTRLQEDAITASWNCEKFVQFETKSVERLKADAMTSK